MIPLDYAIDRLALAVATALAGHDAAEVLRSGGSELADELVEAVCSHVGCVEAGIEHAGGGHEPGHA